MTKEEAITNLNMISVAFVEPITKEQRKLINDTFEMAIKSLEQEPCEDAISRAAAIKKVSEGLKHTFVEHEDIAQKMLADLPSVTPEQRIGHWVKISPAGIYECSECGQNVMTGDIDAYMHCHGCGAKMAESEGK